MQCIGVILGGAKQEIMVIYLGELIYEKNKNLNEDLNEDDHKYHDLVKCIFYTFICLAPFGHLILSIISHNYDKMLVSAIATFISSIMIGIIWTLYAVFCTNVKNIYTLLSKRW